VQPHTLCGVQVCQFISAQSGMRATQDAGVVRVHGDGSFTRKEVACFVLALVAAVLMVAFFIGLFCCGWCTVGLTAHTDIGTPKEAARHKRDHMKRATAGGITGSSSSGSEPESGGCLAASKPSLHPEMSSIRQRSELFVVIAPEDEGAAEQCESGAGPGEACLPPVSAAQLDPQEDGLSMRLPTALFLANPVVRPPPPLLVCSDSSVMSP
jgi:hypothetical protein